MLAIRDRHMINASSSLLIRINNQETTRSAVRKRYVNTATNDHKEIAQPNRRTLLVQHQWLSLLLSPGTK